MRETRVILCTVTYDETVLAITNCDNKELQEICNAVYKNNENGKGKSYSLVSRELFPDNLFRQLADTGEAAMIEPLKELEGRCVANTGDVTISVIQSSGEADKYDYEWLHTDDNQWVKPLGNRNFELVEIRELPDGYVVAYGRFSPVEYTDEDIDDVLQSYGYKDQADVIAQYGDGADQIIAECLFEQTSETELGTLPVAATYEDAEKLAEEYMKEN